MTELRIERHHHLDHAARHRAVGALVGSAVGDALGAPFEFEAGGRYSVQFPQPVVGGTGEMVGGGGFRWRPGEFTDDTQMAVAMAESLVAHDGIDRDDLWLRWRAWAQQASDVGIITRRALSAPHWQSAAADAHAVLGRSAGNGALMRVTPIGLAYATLPPAVATERTIAAVLEQSALTHHDPAAGWGAAIAAELIRRTVLGADPIAELDAVIALLPDDQRVRYAEMLAPEWQPGRDGDPGNGSVWTCLAQAVWAVRHHQNFHDAVVAAIDLGDDTDTVACVTGALAGARSGIQAIPSRWTTYVHGRVLSPTGWDRYDNAGLQALALRLIGVEGGSEAPAEVQIWPTEILEGVYGCDFAGAAQYGADGDFAVLSLCRVGDAFKDVAVRREVYMVDQEGDRNPGLRQALVDAVDTIDAWRFEGRKVLVHCHGGRSRTALVVKAWVMRHHPDWTEQDAQDWMTDAWSRYDPWNRTFREVLRTDWDH